MRFCFHDWSKWSAPLDTCSDNRKVQSRYCLNCNKSEVAKINQPFWLFFDAKNLATGSSIKENT